MMSKQVIVKGIFILSLMMLLLGGGLLAFAQTDKAKEEGLTQVETKYVCMINNQRFEKEQIAVTVDDQTYYGCCEMCKEKLKNDKASRMATDPVSKKQVDKAKAIIGATADGKVYYFESVDNLKKFKPAADDHSGHGEHSKHNNH